MAISNNNLGYSTHILGTVKSVRESLGIILYNEESFDKKISLYNIDEMYALVTSDPGKYYKLTRNDLDSVFLYERSESPIKGFNTIIYLSSVDGSPLGYTEFLNKQGEDRDINLTIALEADLKEGSIVIINYLASLQGSNTEAKKDIGSKLNEFTNMSLVKKEKEKSEKYTTSITQLNHSPGVLNTSSNTLYSRDKDDVKIKAFDFIINGNANLYQVGFTDRNIGYYNGDLVLYSWFDKVNYCVTSLTKINKFGNPIVYTKSGQGYLTLSYPNAEVSIDYGAGRYLVCTIISNGSTKTDLYNIEEERFMLIPEGNIIIDPLDIKSTVYILPTILTTDTLFQHIPDISSVFLDIKEYSSKYTPEIYRKTGNWYILKRHYRFSDYLYICAGITNTIFLSNEDIDSLILVNDNTAVIQENDYYVLYSGLKQNYYTERTKILLGQGEEGVVKIEDVDFYYCKNGRSEEEVIEEYKDRVAPKNYPIYKTFFNNFRRGAYPYFLSTLPEFLDAANGIIFYKNKYNLNYL